MLSGSSVRAQLHLPFDTGNERLMAGLRMKEVGSPFSCPLIYENLKRHTQCSWHRRRCGF